MAHVIHRNSTHDVLMYPSSHRFASTTNSTATATTPPAPSDYIQDYILVAIIGIYLLLGAILWSTTGPSSENERRIREKFSWFLDGKWEWVYGLFLVWLWPFMLILWWKVERERRRDVKALEDFEGGISCWIRARKRPRAGAETGKCRMMLWE